MWSEVSWQTPGEDERHEITMKFSVASSNFVICTSANQFTDVFVCHDKYLS